MQEIIVATVFPELFRTFREYGLISRAVEKNILDLRAENLRDYSPDTKHHKVDDYLYGGGPGLLYKPQAPASFVRKNKKSRRDRVVLMAPYGRRVDRDIVCEYTQYSRLLIVCGRYEGVDQRFVDRYCDDVLAVGDFVVMGGEIPAMMLLEAVVRRQPGVLGNQSSYEEDSFEEGLLEGGSYTRPFEFEKELVPEVLRSGNHKAIQRWKRYSGLRATLQNRPELLAEADLTCEDRTDLKTIYKELYCGYNTDD